MQIPLQVSFRGIPHSEELEAIVREKAVRLDRFAKNILRCHVMIQLAGQHHQHGNLYEVRIDLTVPGEEIAVTRQPSEHTEYRDIHVALRDAFDSARRQLEDYVRRRSGLVKTPHTLPHAQVSKLVADEGYGFLATPDGRQIYFHRNSVLDDGFDRLEPGSEVSFVEEQGESGPQASTVKLVGRHGHL